METNLTALCLRENVRGGSETVSVGPTQPLEHQSHQFPNANSGLLNHL